MRQFIFLSKGHAERLRMKNKKEVRKSKSEEGARKAIRSVATGRKKKLATLISTIYSVIYGDERSPVRHRSHVISSASSRNWTGTCQEKLLFIRSRKK